MQAPPDARLEHPARRFVVERWLVPVNVASFFALTLAVFAVNVDALFLRWDGTAHLLETGNQFRWGGPLLSFHLNPLLGNGDLNYINQYRLLPHMALGYWLGGAEIARPFAAAAAAGLYFSAVLAALRVFGLGIAHACLAAWALCFLLLPYHVPPPTFIRAWGNMPLLPGLGAALLCVALWWRIGSPERGWARDARDGAIMLALVAWIAAATPAVAAMAMPAMVWFGLARLVAADAAERRRCLVVGVVLALPAAPFVWHVVEVQLYSKVAFFAAELETLQTGLRQISFFVYIHGEGTPLGEAILWAGGIGAAICAAVQPGLLRRLALSYLGLFATLIALALGFDVFAGGWSGPPLAYVDLTIAPLHVAFALAPLVLSVSALARLAARAHWARDGLDRARIAIPLALAAIGWLALPHALWRVGGPEFRAHGPWPWPQARTPLAAYLESRIGLYQDPVFRGRVVSFMGYAGEKNPFNAQHAYENGLIYASGNDHRANGLWFLGVPTLSSSVHLTSPYFEAVANKLLSARGVEMTRAHTTATKFDARLLAAFGARYVIAPTPIDGARPVERFAAGPATLVLHELAKVNLGDYAATTVERVPDMRAALTRMADPSFDPAAMAVIHEAPPGALSPTRDARLAFAPDLVAFEARSDGLALALLPLDFTRCFEIRFASSGAVAPRALRANVSQTAILFERDVRAEIRLRFGPFTNVGCRMRDLADARALGMARVAGWWP